MYQQLVSIKELYYDARPTKSQDMSLGFVVPCFFSHSNTQLGATINRKILLLCRTDTAEHVSGITMPIIRSPSNCRCSLWFPYEYGGGRVLSSGRFVSGAPTNKPTLLTNRHCSTFFGHYYAHYQEPVKLTLQPLVSVWMWRWKCSQQWSVC